MDRLYAKTFEEYCNEHKFYFQNITGTDHPWIREIHPLKQRLAAKIADLVQETNLCKRVIVFGSSISMKCNMYSDIDVAVELINDSRENRNYVSEIIGETSNWNYDVIWLNDLDKSERIWDSIKRGVVICE